MPPARIVWSIVLPGALPSIFVGLRYGLGIMWLTLIVAETISAEPVPRHRIILASLIGTTIEFYDFYIFATAAVSVFPLIRSRRIRQCSRTADRG